MKKKIILITISIIIILIAYLIWKDSGFRFISKVTQVYLPNGSSNQKVYDNSENYIIGYANLPKNRVTSFLKEYNFQPASKPIEKLILINSLIEKNTEFPPIEVNEFLYYLLGNKNKRPWEYIVNKETGQLWVFLNYPDYAGN
jgi:hypothetical protein